VALLAVTPGKSGMSSKKNVAGTCRISACKRVHANR
jgi:hypothetical protein